MIIISFFLLLQALCWLYFGLALLVPFFMPDFGAVPLANLVGALFYVGVFFYGLFPLIKLFRDKEEGVVSIKGFAVFMFFVLLIFWLPSDLIEGNPVEIRFSISVLILNSILWHLSNRLMRQLPDFTQEAENNG